MKYIALLRGINVGTSRRIDMKSLKAFFMDLGHQDVTTYINSGNMIFQSYRKTDAIRQELEAGLEKEFRIKTRVLMKTETEMRRIARAIPEDWQNDDRQRTDVAYLFPEADQKGIMDELPVKREFLDLVYLKGALIWHMERVHYSKSRLNKLISHPAYQLMTVRNANTARYLAGKI